MKHRKIGILLAVVLACVVMALVETVIRPGYYIKSAIKLAMFALIPIALTYGCHLTALKEIFRFRKRGFAAALGLGIGVYAVILGGYFLIRPFFDFSGIAGKLTQNAGVTKDNFLYVSLYISFVNSLLEEFFFRGFLFSNLKTASTRGFAYGFSAVTFSLYHVAMMIGWFNLWLYALVLAGLAVGGVIFNYLNEKLGCIYASWLTHMFANFAINTIGFLLLQ